MSTFSQTAMLVSLNLRSYTARREDKKISREIATQHNADSDAGKYNKQLVSKRFLDPITKADSEIRQYLYEHTLSWLDDGTRVLPSAMYQTFKAGMAQLVDKREIAVRDFCAKWDSEIIPDARQRLNGMFQDADYPADVGARFGYRLKFLPVPDANDFRVNVSDMERETLREQIAANLQDASQNAMRELWERAMEPVKAMADKLAAYKVTIVDGKPKAENVFRDSLIENLRDVCALLPDLNFAGDARLAAIGSRIESTLLQHSAQELRDDMRVREDVAAKAAEIARDMGEFMAG